MSSCDYDCPAEAPLSYHDSDITGIGIVTNYVATASIAVLIIIVYYLGVYQPSHDPFDKGDQIDDTFRPNPVDEVFLQAVRWGPKRFLRCTLESRRMSPNFRIRLEQTFIKCILLMSDLQIITGFSILISGFVQLPCGLTVYHWVCIINLAWFSCLTHLSCLTVLRGHLYRFSAERLWRLLAMGVLVTFLVVGLLSTGTTAYTNRDPAICAIWVIPSLTEDDITFWSTIVSAILIIVAFVSRVIKLHKALSVGVFGRGRIWLSIRARRILHIVFNWACKERHPHSLRRSICYRPLLAVFLAARLICDGWSSILLEVTWLLIAFAWGILRLVVELSDGLVGNWTFGQVVAVVLLATPFITMMQCFNKDAIYSPAAGLENESYEPHTTYPIQSMSMDEGLIDSESPDRDWDSYTGTLKAGVFYAVLSWFAWSFCTLYMASSHSPLTGVVRVSNVYPFLFTAMYELILFSLLIRAISFKGNRWLYFLLQFVNVAFFTLSPAFGCFSFGDSAFPSLPDGLVNPTLFTSLSGGLVNPSLFAHIAAVGVYIMVALGYRLFL